MTERDVWEGGVWQTWDMYTTVDHGFRECSFEKCWGGPENGGGPYKFRIGFGGGQVNSAVDLGGVM